MRVANRQEVATFSFLGVSERIVIGEDENLGWCMHYLRVNGAEPTATITGKKSLEELLECVKDFMIGRGQGLLCDLIQSSEIFLPSTAAMN